MRCAELEDLRDRPAAQPLRRRGLRRSHRGARREPASRNVDQVDDEHVFNRYHDKNWSPPALFCASARDHLDDWEGVSARANMSQLTACSQAPRLAGCCVASVTWLRHTLAGAVGLAGKVDPARAHPRADRGGANRAGQRRRGRAPRRARSARRRAPGGRTAAWPRFPPRARAAWVDSDGCDSPSACAAAVSVPAAVDGEGRVELIERNAKARSVAQAMPCPRRRAASRSCCCCGAELLKVGICSCRNRP